ncbi:MAG: S49 family peptidase [Gammaproteobacteria bacterium]
MESNSRSNVEINALILEYIREQKRARRWAMLFKFSVLGLVLFLALKAGNPVGHLGQSPVALTQKEHTAVISITGTIMAGEETNAEVVIESLKKAFKDKKAQAIILKINSPGGSAVQARQIWDAINYLKKSSPSKKVYAVIEDFGASGAYLIASAADFIYADQTSLVGSIGVIMGGFGFVDAMKDWGIERRLYTAGKNKALLDPFSPKKPESEEHIKQMLEEVHAAFISNVKQGRQNKLKLDNPDLFSGLIWTGLEAKNLGLIDDFGDIYSVSRDIIKAPDLLDYGPNNDWFLKLAKGLNYMFKN